MVILAFLIYRCLRFLLLFIILSAGIFLLLEILPGDPAVVMLGTNADPETLAALRAELGLDQPLLFRLFDSLIRLAQGNLGVSQTYGLPVSQLIRERLAVSLPLMLGVMLLSQTGGVVVGIARASVRPQPVKSMIAIMIAFALAIPPFWLAIILILIFALWLDWLPSMGFPSDLADWQDALAALILPLFALIPAQAAIIARVVSVNLEIILDQPYIITAFAKGCRLQRVLWHHALPHTALPLMTLAGLQTAYLFAGSVVVETIFSLPGLGHLLVQAAQRQDLTVVRALILIFIAVTLFINQIADGLCRVIDSRLSRTSL